MHIKISQPAQRPKIVEVLYFTYYAPFLIFDHRIEWTEKKSMKKINKDVWVVKMSVWIELSLWYYWTISILFLFSNMILLSYNVSEIIFLALQVWGNFKISHEILIYFKLNYEVLKLYRFIHYVVWRSSPSLNWRLAIWGTCIELTYKPHLPNLNHNFAIDVILVYTTLI